MRLTKYTRSNIVRKVVAATFDAREAALKLEEYAVAKVVRDFFLTDHEIAKIEALPAKFFFPSGYAITAKLIDGESNQYHQVHTSPKLRLPHFLIHGVHLVDTATWEAVVTIREKHKVIAKEKEVFEAQTRGVLNSYTDSVKLLKDWPTLRTVMGDDFFRYVAPLNLPSTTVNALDAALTEAMKKAA